MHTLNGLPSIHVQVSSLSLTGDVHKLDRILSNETRSVPVLRRLSYDERLNLFSWERHREMNYLIQLCKMLNGRYRIPASALCLQVINLWNSLLIFKSRMAEVRTLFNPSLSPIIPTYQSPLPCFCCFFLQLHF